MSRTRGKHDYFVVRRSRVQFSDRKMAIMIQEIRVFPQSFKIYVGIGS